MARKPASSSATGGAGYNYADKVAAKYLLDMLAGRSPLGPDFGQVVRVDWETRDIANGWLIDDLRLTLRSHNGDLFVAISMKRNRQVTRAGFPSDFVYDAWEMILGRATSEFMPSRDLLTLVVGQLSQNVRESWEGLLRSSIETTADRLVNRVSQRGTASNLQRALFDSLHCPKRLQNHLKKPVETATADVVSRIRLLHLDFDSEPSKSCADALTLAREVTHSGTVEDARLLWGALVAIAATQRASGGYEDLHILLSKLNHPALHEHPDLRRDWDQISRVCNEATARTRTDLGEFSLVRADVFDRVLGMVDPQRVGVLLGDSGSGKSALAKRLTFRIDGPTIWLDSILLNVTSLAELQTQKLFIQVGLERLICDLAAPHGLIVIDGIDQLSPAGLQVAMQVIQAASAGPKWSVNVSCRTDAWNRIVPVFLSGKIPLNQDNVLPIPLLDWAELSVVASSLPSVSALLQRPEVRPLLANAKVLEWTITAINHSSDSAAASARSVPGLIDAIWDRWVRSSSSRYSREHTLKCIAEKEAEGLGTITLLSDLSQHHQPLEGLVDDELLAEHEQQIRFRHGLIGDWTRLKILIEHQTDDVKALRERVGLPLWQCAIQLYGQRVLQYGDNGSERWKQLMSKLQGDEDDDLAVLIRDLMLESLFKATDTMALIELAWPTLVTDHGYLLKRLLDRFSYAGTLPAVSQSTGLGTEEKLLLQSMSRYPFWPYWLPVLRSLHSHCDDVVTLAPRQVATIASLWLKWMPLVVSREKQFPCRDEAADLAIRVAFEIHARYQEKRWCGRDDGVSTAAYGALLQAAQDRPDDVAELCLEIAGRKPLSASVCDRVTKYEADQRHLAEEAAKRRTPKQERQPQEAVNGLSTILPRGKMIAPFPDGPSRPIDDEFRKACLEFDAILPLLKSRPDAAKEVFLAACIKSPYREGPCYNTDLSMDLDIEGPVRGSEPMWFQGPFWRMLQDCLEDALDIIIRLVGFATSRWKEWDCQCQGRRGNADETILHHVSVLTPNGERELLGDTRVYGWYRNRFGDSPLVVNALMALEKYLYDQVDADADISPVVNTILAEADSVAFVGVLLAIGRYQLAIKQSNALLCGLLRPLLSIWQVYQWDRVVIHDTEIRQQWKLGLVHWAPLGERVFNLAQDWNTMPHRTVDLTDVAVRLLLSRGEIREWFETVKVKWKEDAAIKDDEILEILLARFDFENYRFEKVDKGVSIFFEWPEHLRGRTEKALIDSQQALAGLVFPVRCRDLLNQLNSPSDDEAEELWEQVMKLVEQENCEGKLGEQITNIIFGGIAVFVCRKMEWLECNPERLKWCADRLADFAVYSPGFGNIATPYSITETTWDVFFAESAVHLLAHDRMDSRYRLWTCRGLCAFHYVATGIGMAAVWRCRDELGDDFYRLVNIITAWACTRHLIQCANNCNQPHDRYARWMDRAISNFVTGVYTEKLIPIDRVSGFGARISERIREQDDRKRWRDDVGKKGKKDGGDLPRIHGITHHRNRQRGDPGLDVTVIQHALSPLHDLGEHGSTLRAVQLQIFEQALGVTLRMLGTPTKEFEGERVGVPTDYDRWALREVGQVLVQMTDDENPRNLWKQVLEICATADYWLKSFSSAWVSDGLASCDNLERWGCRWREMIEFALEAPNWSRGQRGARNLEEAWIELLGMGLGGHRLRGRKDLAPIISSLVPHYQRWAKEWLSKARCASAFADFIVKPAAQPLLMIGVKWLIENAKGWRDSDWEFYHLQNVLLSVAHYLWLNCRSTLESDTDCRSLFLVF